MLPHQRQSINARIVRVIPRTRVKEALSADLSSTEKVEQKHERL
jgi:hypothetical protein